MITKEHVRIFDKYLGDDDGFARCSTSHEKEYFQKGEWELIVSILQDLALVNNELASKQCEEELNIRLNKHVEFDAIEVLKRKTNA
ncbi:hypothetical protein [Adhaeribacter rhizoryzae]|uniref:hypothetical protein n=1 Tax=Adhaeribacter rhizoryzae TaxID=2607907 RepID=UPI0012328883|nr:hypothetical protein [Adhaeribacter rhizoryzae]